MNKVLEKVGKKKSQEGQNEHKKREENIN